MFMLLAPFSKGIGRVPFIPARTVTSGGRTGFFMPRGLRGRFENAPYQQLRNVDAEVRGRVYSGHALDRMQNQGIMPSVVENTIRTGIRAPAKMGRTSFYDRVNNVTVITEGRRIVSTYFGKPGKP
jgi:hypothetical protein